MDLPHAVSKQNQKWYENYSLLKEYKERFGNSNVPKNWKENPKLSNWVRKQRDVYKKNSSQLTDIRIRLLNELDFRWFIEPDKSKARNGLNSTSSVNEIHHEPVTQKNKWHSNYMKLKVFKQVYGSCDVPRNWTEDPSLSNWVRKQRDEYRMVPKRLTEERIKLLNKIGFRWWIKKSLTELVDELEVLLKQVKTKKRYRKSESIKMDWWTMVGRGVNQYMFKSFEHRHNLPGKQHLGVNMMDVYDKKTYEPWELELYEKASEILKLLDPEYMGNDRDWAVQFSKFSDISEHAVDWHVDRRDVSYSYTLSLGEYDGVLWNCKKIDGTIVSFCDKRTFVKVDTRLLHRFEIDESTFFGEVYHVIFFKNYDRRQTKEDDLCDPKIICKV